MAPISMKTKTEGPLSPGTSSTGGLRNPVAQERSTRDRYFRGREDVSQDRLDRRQAQADELQKFKDQYVRNVSGSSNLLQMTKDAPMSLAEKERQLALKYGPTPKEIMSDVGYAVSSAAKGFGIPFVSSAMRAADLARGIFDKSVSTFNSAYDKLNDVGKYIFENKNKLTFASKMPSVRQAEDASMQLLEDQKRLDILNRYKERALFQEYRSRFMDPLMQAETQSIVPEYQTQSIVPEYQRSFEVTESQPTRDVKVLPPEDQTVLSPFPGDNTKQQETTVPSNKTKSEVGFFDLLNPFDEVPIQMGINEMLNPDAVDLEEWKKQNKQSYSIIPEAGAAEMGTQVTAYNNPGNLKFANQASAVQGQTYGPGYAVFPTAEAGLDALRADLTAKIERSNKVDDIIGEYAPRSDNKESFDNYVKFVKQGVGETVEPNEMKELTKRIIQFENKPEIANKYLTMVADGGMIDKQLKSLQNGLQNMYNGIPSVKRR